MHSDSQILILSNSIKKRIRVLLPVAVNQPFDYAVPGGMKPSLGQFVKVPFGGKDAIGVVWSEEGDPAYAEKKARFVTCVMDVPALSKNLMEFIDWVASYTMAEKGMVLAMSIAALKNIKEPKRKKGEQKARASHELAEPCPTEGLGSPAEGLLKLSADQTQVFEELLPHIAADNFNVTLLDGVTGSGKTEVYFAAIKKSLADHPDHQILIMLPEIALTSQLIERVRKRLGIEPVLWHSGLTPTRRAKNWQSIIKGEAKLVIGARSSLFLPFNNLSLIIIDEEHDASYKQEEGVIYNARDMAVVRAKIEKIPLILVSATPSLETVVNVETKKYSEISLKNRYGEAKLPEIEIIDLRAEKLPKNSWVSEKLRLEMAETLGRGEQSLIYLNRRGYAPLTICRACGHHLKCPNCSSWLVEHRSQKSEARNQKSEARNQKSEARNQKSEARNQKPEARSQKPENLISDSRLRASVLQCHHCGYSSKMLEKCPACAALGKLVPLGPGVERLEDEIKEFLPQARIANMTSDSVTTAKELNELFAKIENKEIDVIIGTQMIAKGHHFPEITLVGIIDADSGLLGGDIRGAERTFQVLQQVSGRAGREKLAGKVIIQTFMPENRVIKTLVSGDRQEFLGIESQVRRNNHLPPFGRMASLIISGKDELKVKKLCQELARAMPHFKNVHILGPAPAPMTLLRGRYRYRFLIKADNNVKLQSLIDNWLRSIEIPSWARVKIDIDPYSFM